jgi:pimeloyl-ACP methyl ester carboxylesterase
MKLRRRHKILGIVVTVVTLLLVIAFMAFDKETELLGDSARSKAPGEFISLKNGIVHYELKGPEGGPVVVLVHGFSAPCFTWDPTFEALAAEGFRVLSFDLYGRGYSDRPEVDNTLDLFVTQLGELATALKLKTPFDLVGLSMGGPITAAFTNRNPKKVRSLTLVDPLTEPLTFGKIFPAGVPLIGEYVMGVYVVPFLMPANQKRDFYSFERFPDWIDRYEVQMKYKGFRRSILSTLRNVLQDVRPLQEYAAIGKTNRCVLLLRGEADLTVTPQNIAAIRKVITDAEFHEIPLAAHLPHYERPDAVNPILVGFLRSCGH